jgi:hypothetical protein
MKILKNDKAKFKAAVRKYLKTHSCYFVDEFFMYKGDQQYCFVKCLYYFTLFKLCIFVYLSLVLHPAVFDTRMEPWNVFMYMNLCKYVCIYSCVLSSHSTDWQFWSVLWLSNVSVTENYVMCGKFVCRRWCTCWCLSYPCSNGRFDNLWFVVLFRLFWDV